MMNSNLASELGDFKYRSLHRLRGSIADVLQKGEVVAYRASSDRANKGNQASNEKAIGDNPVACIVWTLLSSTGSRNSRPPTPIR